MATSSQFLLKKTLKRLLNYRASCWS